MMKVGFADGAAYFVLFLAVILEATLWYGCHLEVENSLYKDRQIAIRSSCNEEAELYSERLDCTDIKRSNQPGLSWIRSTQCLASRHNIFAMMGWLQIGAVVALGFAILALVIRYRLKVHKRQGRHDRMLLLQGPRMIPMQHASHVEDID